MDPIKIGKTIKALRTKAGLKQQDIADAIHVTDKAVSRWERGIGIPDISIIHKLADYLNVDIDNLLEGNIAYLENDWKGLLLLDQMELEVDIGSYVYDKPLTDIWLSYFILVGIKHIIIKADERDRETLRGIYGNGERLGLTISYINELSEITKSNYMLILGSVFLYGANLTKVFQRAMAKDLKVTKLVIPKHNGDEKNRFVVNTKDLTSDANAWKQTYYGLPIFFIPYTSFSSVFNNGVIALDEDKMNFQTFGKGMVECNLCTFDDIAEVSNFIRFIEHNTGFCIYSIEEIAWRRGFASAENLLENVNLRSGNRSYLLSLFYETNEGEEPE